MSYKINSVLIIDDDEISNFITESILEQSGKVKNVNIEMSADEGLTYLSKVAKKNLANTPTLVLLDIKMPVKSGWDFLNELRDLQELKGNDMIIVMLSSSVYPDDVHKANNYSEVAGYLSKPITLEKVDEIIEKYIPKQ